MEDDSLLCKLYIYIYKYWKQEKNYTLVKKCSFFLLAIFISRSTLTYRALYYGKIETQTSYIYLYIYIYIYVVCTIYIYIYICSLYKGEWTTYVDLNPLLTRRVSAYAFFRGLDCVLYSIIVYVHQLRLCGI